MARHCHTAGEFDALQGILALRPRQLLLELHTHRSSYSLGEGDKWYRRNAEGKDAPTPVTFSAWEDLHRRLQEAGYRVFYRDRPRQGRLVEVGLTLQLETPSEPSMDVQRTSSNARGAPPPFAAAALWAGLQKDCEKQQAPKNYARRTFACAGAYTYALNNARLALCSGPNDASEVCSEFKAPILLRAQRKCETFQCAPPDLMHLKTSAPSAKNKYLGCTGVTTTGKDFGVCQSYFKAVQHLIEKHRNRLRDNSPTHVPPQASHVSTGPPRMAPPVVLSNGVQMPALCFGLGRLAGNPRAEWLISVALKTGYRCFDTSMLYDGTEAALGRAWQASGIPRAELFFKTKLLTWDDDDEHLATHIYSEAGGVRRVFHEQLARLQTDYGACRCASLAHHPDLRPQAHCGSR